VIIFDKTSNLKLATDLLATGRGSPGIRGAHFGNHCFGVM